MSVIAGTHETAPAVPDLPHERVLDALAECVLRWGVQKTTVEDVARAAGLSRATVYRLFPGGKSAMLEAGALALVTDLTAQVGVAAAAAPDLTGALTAVMVTATELLGSDELLHFLMENDPAALDAQLALGGLDRLMVAVGDGVGPVLEPFVGDAAGAREAAVWAARTVASYLLDPADDVDLAVPATARHLVTTYFLPGSVPGPAT